MIDYGRLKAAGNAVLDNPIRIEGVLESIDITYILYDSYSGESLGTQTQTIQRDHILNHKNSLEKERQGLILRAAKLQIKENNMQEFIIDALAI